MIPKVIHYCWFGGKPLPELAQKCIESWKKYFPDYKIKEWNESNFNLECCSYVREAYKEKKWAFVSDYARFWILYHEGGIYFDTDVEVIKNFENIIDKGAFMGCENIDKFKLGINPGLGLGAPPGLKLYREILEYYQTMHFKYKKETIQTVVYYTTEILKKYNWNEVGRIELIENIYIYPPEYFCPFNYITGEWNITDKTVSIHHYAATWHSWLEDKIMFIERCDQIAHPIQYKIRRCISFPFRALNKIEKLGLKETIKFIKKKI